MFSLLPPRPTRGSVGGCVATGERVCPPRASVRPCFVACRSASGSSKGELTDGVCSSVRFAVCVGLACAEDPREEGASDGRHG
eukprot:5857978-Prymnesium_polylepis.1